MEQAFERHTLYENGRTTFRFCYDPRIIPKTDHRGHDKFLSTQAMRLLGIFEALGIPVEEHGYSRREVGQKPVEASSYVMVTTDDFPRDPKVRLSLELGIHKQITADLLQLATL